MSHRTTGLAQRIVTLGLGLYLVIAGLVTVGELAYLAGHTKAEIDEQTDVLAAAFAAPISLALWDYDEGQLEILLSTLSSNPAVGRVVVVEPDGPRLTRESSGPLGPPRTYPLVHQRLGRSEVLGQLVLEPSLKVVDRRLADALQVALARTLILVVLLSVVLVAVVRIKVGRPLTRLADQVSSLDPQGTEDPILSTDPGAGIELQKVSEVFLRLLTGYRSTIARLDHQQAQLRTLLDTLPDLVWMKDQDGVYLACNKRFESFFGAGEADILGKTDVDFVGEEASELFRQYDRQAIALGQPCRNEEEITFASDGHREYLETIKTPVFDAEGRIIGVLGIGRDITERRRAALELERLLQELRQSHKLESLGHLAGGLAHEMNNVLAAILGLTSVHLRTLPPESKLHSSLNSIHRAADRGARLVKSLLSFARQSPAEARVFDINGLLDAEHGLVERVTASRVNLVFDLEAGAGFLRGDPDAILSALLNLCGNAVDAMADGGTLTVKTRRIGGWIEITIEDTGAGMTPEVLARATDPFFTTKEVGRGTGLGLPFVDSTARAHGGRLELVSEPGRGTTARLILPASEGPSLSAEASDPEATDSLSVALEILVVDDDELVRETTLEICETLGHRVSGASGGEEALSLLAAGPIPDLIILDKNMPGMGGRATLARLRELLPHLPVLLATGQTDQEALDLIDHDPLVHLLGKPFSVSELNQKLVVAIGPGPQIKKRPQKDR